MRMLIGLAVLAMIAAPAAADVLIDDSLSGSPPGDWIKVGGGPDARAETDHGGDGDWAVGGSDGSGNSAPYDNYYYQSFAPPNGPGVYDVDLSGWSKAWAGWWSGENWGWLQEAHLELLIDGAMVFDGAAYNDGAYWDTWLNHTYQAQHTINSSIEVRLHSIKGNSHDGTGGEGAIWYDSRYDDIYLEVVPEPATAMLLGFASLALLRRRR